MKGPVVIGKELRSPPKKGQKSVSDRCGLAVKRARDSGPNATGEVFCRLDLDLVLFAALSEGVNGSRKFLTVETCGDKRNADKGSPFDERKGREARRGLGIY